MSVPKPLIVESHFPQIRRGRLDTVQVNLGYRCNQACHHCHVEAGPKRSEEMSLQTIEEVLLLLERSGANTLDITGGAPELNPHFRYLVMAARTLGCHVMDRCNLTVLLEPKQETLAQFLAQHQVEVVASLPCYLESNVDAQRGKGVFNKSIEAMRVLNEWGYAQPGSPLTLNIVYNPQGANLPPNQQILQQQYQAHLYKNYGINFNQLYTLTNMPIQRFAHQLRRQQQLEDYYQLLEQNYQDDNLAEVMCRHLISVDWQGYLYDCDFNQMLALPLGGAASRTHISEWQAENVLEAEINTGRHCFACTAGQGSSCGGALKQTEQ